MGKAFLSGIRCLSIGSLRACSTATAFTPRTYSLFFITRKIDTGWDSTRTTRRFIGRIYRMHRYMWEARIEMLTASPTSTPNHTSKKWHACLDIQSSRHSIATLPRMWIEVVRVLLSSWQLFVVQSVENQRVFRFSRRLYQLWRWWRWAFLLSSHSRGDFYCCFFWNKLVLLLPLNISSIFLFLASIPLQFPLSSMYESPGEAEVSFLILVSAILPIGTETV